MALLDTLRSLTGPRREALVWDCSNRTKLFTAAFELHEVAMHAGFSPDEATSLSLTLAELGTRAASKRCGASASVYLRPDGWRVEVPGAWKKEREEVRRRVERLVEKLSALA